MVGPGSANAVVYSTSVIVLGMVSVIGPVTVPVVCVIMSAATGGEFWAVSVARDAGRQHVVSGRDEPESDSDFVHRP